MSISDRQKNCIILVALGLFTVLGYGMLDIEFGGALVPNAEAWQRGVAQPYVISGIVLIVLALLHYQGQIWLRWPILFWCPLTFVGGAAWSISRGVGEFLPLEFIFLAFPVITIWFWGVRRMLFGRAPTEAA